MDPKRFPKKWNWRLNSTLNGTEKYKETWERVFGKKNKDKKKKCQE